MKVAFQSWFFLSIERGVSFFLIRLNYDDTSIFKFGKSNSSNSTVAKWSCVNDSNFQFFIVSQPKPAEVIDRI